MYRKKVHLQMLIEPRPVLISWAKFYHMDIDIRDKMLTIELVNKFHKKKLKTNCWIVNDESMLRHLEEIGCDYITTDTFDQNS